MITVCSGFPLDWPAEAVERFTSSFERHWPVASWLEADRLPEGGTVDRYQLVIPAEVADRMDDGDLLAWLDPDIVTVAPVPSFVLPNLAKGADLAFIGRADGSSDLSFWIVRLSGPVRSFLADLASRARTADDPDAAWIAARAAAGLVERDLTPGGSDMWAHGPLGRYSRRGG